MLHISPVILFKYYRYQREYYYEKGDIRGKS